MIGRIRGVLIERQAPELVVDVMGVGYELHVPLSTLFKLPALGEEVTLYTHFSVSENSQSLYGFAERNERELFRTLIKVSGVGPKLGLAILSGMGAEEFVKLVQRGDAAALVKLPGVGKKTAERLVIEMRDRLKSWQSAPAPLFDGKMVQTEAATANINVLVADAESALVALGYKPTDAAKAINRVLDDGVTSSEELIRMALKGMA
ncbi:Holliday junction DNA helicase subunit RuvA [Sinobacterium caligoides]|uniref:Holliday junction branch migration complex subunit RuvA n=1 Tax=Sinobacterium caligoides TaxID=933926 RepID=A0A3N2DG07_9GAMM|nr:Holliday junction branch migration protein RuvA [Sinobacterium caligoides]ROR98727.1 Holliday junction DNA helicase subunit RuvA [Sinobacterium caligoides]